MAIAPCNSKFWGRGGGQSFVHGPPTTATGSRLRPISPRSPAMNDANGHRSGLEQKSYTSFGNKPMTIPASPRKLWNASHFSPSRFYPPQPSPMHYNPQPQLSERSIPIARGKRDDEATPTFALTPGPGAYSTTAVDEPFTGYASPGSPTLPPSLKNAPALPRSPRKKIPRDHHPIGETGTYLDGHLIRSGIPGPQEYNPGMSVFPQNKLGAFQGRGERFRASGDLSLPGPGAYDSPGKAQPAGPKLYRRARNLDRIVADHRNLNHEAKAPGPGSYDPLMKPSGKNAGSFRRNPPASAFIMTLDELYGPQESDGA